VPDDTRISLLPPRESNDNNGAAEKRQELVTNHIVILFMTNYFGISAMVKEDREQSFVAILCGEEEK
jgi:hypothetical protein